jgi:hypothetical protein
MLRTQRDHSFGLVVLSDVPWWIEVVPIQVRVTASWDRTTKADLVAELPLDVSGGRSIHQQAYLPSSIAAPMADDEMRLPT